MNNNRKIYLYINTILSISIMIVIFLFSSENANLSMNTSNSVKDLLLSFLSKFAPESIIDFIDQYIRKLAHFTLYFLLGITTSNAINNGFSFRKHLAYGISSGICIIYAISDEIHQYFVPGRSCSIIDIGIDTLGILSGILLVWVISLIFAYKKKTT